MRRLIRKRHSIKNSTAEILLADDVIQQARTFFRRRLELRGKTRCSYGLEYVYICTVCLIRIKCLKNWIKLSSRILVLREAPWSSWSIWAMCWSVIFFRPIEQRFWTLRARTWCWIWIVLKLFCNAWRARFRRHGWDGQLKVFYLVINLSLVSSISRYILREINTPV